MARLKAPSLANRVEFDLCVDELAEATVALRQMEAVRDERLQAVRTEYEPSCVVLADRIKALNLLAEKYADAHRDEMLPGKGKSAETPLAVYGYRLGQRTLKLLNKSWDWDKVVTALMHPDFVRFIRTRREPDKEAMKQHLTDGLLASVGCRVDQAESFFVEPKEQPRQEAAAS